jgi:P-type E1-E2 ATPase
VDGAQIKTFCFDKTGTLTRNDVSISKIFKIKNEENINFQNIIKELGQEKNHLIWKLFATCHTTKLIND